MPAQPTPGTRAADGRPAHVTAGGATVVKAAAATLTAVMFTVATGMVLTGVPGEGGGVRHTLTESAAAVALGSVYAVPAALVFGSVGSLMTLLTVFAARWTARRGGTDSWYRCLAVHAVLSTVTAPVAAALFARGARSFAFYLAWWAAHLLILTPAVLVGRAAANRTARGEGYASLLWRVAGTAVVAVLAAVTGCVAAAAA